MKIAFVGLGIMGRPMALNLKNAGHDIVAPERASLTAEIRALEPDVYCKAGDYTLDKLDPGERAALEENGARIEFMPFLPGFSTTQLIERIRAAGEI